MRSMLMKTAGPLSTKTCSILAAASFGVSAAAWSADLVGPPQRPSPLPVTLPHTNNPFLDYQEFLRVLDTLPDRLPQTGSTNFTQVFDQETRALFKRFPQYPEAAILLVHNAQNWLYAGQADRARASLLLAQSGNLPPQDREQAILIEKQSQLLHQPLNWKLHSLEGAAIDVSKLRGKVVLIQWWATWCGPCLAELPQLRELYKKHKTSGLEILGLSLDENRKQLQVFASQQVPWPVIQQGVSARAEEYGVRSVPALWLLNRKGQLEHLNAAVDLETKVLRLLKE